MLRVDNLVKYFGRGTVNEMLALDHARLHVRPGEFICIIGSNGAGKSTLMSCIAGAVLPDEGTISLEGEDITQQPEYRRAAHIGRVFQDPLSGTCAGMTIEENMALALRRGKRRGLSGGVKKAERELFRHKMSRLDLGLENRLKDRMGLLSGGQRQSLTMIMATLVRPKLLLLDEHTAALDPKTAQLIMDLTEEIVRNDDLTTLMITHNLQDALAHGDRLIMMHQGKVALDIAGRDKQSLTVADLLEQFKEATNSGRIADSAVLG